MSLDNMTIGQLEPERPAPEPWDEEDVFNEPEKPSLLRRVVVKVRLLPMVIFFSTLTLTVRVGDIWEGVDGALSSTVSVSSSEALAQEGGAAPAPAGMPPDPAAQTTTDMMGGGDGVVPMMPEEDRAAIAARMLADDPTLLTQTEIDLLQRHCRAHAGR